MIQDKVLKAEGPLHVVCQCNWCKAHPQQNLSCKSVQARLAAAWGFVKAQPEQEPVQWGVDWGKAGETPCVSIIKRTPNGGIEVVAVEYGPQRTWIGLTDEEMQTLWDRYAHMEMMRAIEAKLKEKNT